MMLITTVDGYDVICDGLILHFDHVPSEIEVEAVVRAIEEAAASVPVVTVEAEDGEVV